LCTFHFELNVRHSVDNEVFFLFSRRRRSRRRSATDRETEMRRGTGEDREGTSGSQTDPCFSNSQLCRQEEVKTQQARREIAGKSRRNQPGGSQGRQKRQERQKKSFEGEEQSQRKIRQQGESSEPAVEGEEHRETREKQEAIGNAQEIPRTSKTREGAEKIVATSEKNRATSFSVTEEESPSQQVTASSIEFPETLRKQPEEK
jgi:hypothetical protein